MNSIFGAGMIYFIFFSVLIGYSLFLTFFKKSFKSFTERMIYSFYTVSPLIIIEIFLRSFDTFDSENNFFTDTLGFLHLLFPLYLNITVLEGKWYYKLIKSILAILLTLVFVIILLLIIAIVIATFTSEKNIDFHFGFS